MKDFKVKYNNGAIHYCVREWRWDFGPMQDFDLWAVLAGEGNLRFSGRDFQLFPGSVALFNPGSRGCATHNPENPLQVAAVHFDFTGNAPIKDYLYADLDNFGFIGELMQQAINAAGNRDQEDADFWLSAALRKILPSGNPNISRHHAEEIEKLCTRIINHPEQSYKVNDLAKEACLCKDHFTRVFKGFKGISPRDFIIKARIQRACALLLNSNMIVSEIADQLGYSSVNFFCRQFKAETGKTVLQFRRKG